MTKETYAPVILGGEGDVNAGRYGGTSDSSIWPSHDRDSARRPLRMLDLCQHGRYCA
jgi:hypothetical protein